MDEIRKLFVELLDAWKDLALSIATSRQYANSKELIAWVNEEYNRKLAAFDKMMESQL